ncbi:chemotaxis protein CheX [Jatrophihabitans fulvus]
MSAPTAPIEVDVDALGTITTDVWTTFVAEDAIAVPAEDVLPTAGDDLAGRVSIEGDATGVVVVRCDPQSAASLTRRLFKLADDAAVDDEAVSDALGELANIVGGNVKSLGLGESRLTLPEVGAGEVIEAGTDPTCVVDVFWPDGRATLLVSPLPATPLEESP